MGRKKESADQNKAVRYETILKLIRERDIETQKDLAEALRSVGFDITQATVSRDIRELKLTKTARGDGSFVYRSEAEPKAAKDQQISAAFYTLFETSVVAVAQVMNQVVIRTLTGMANAVCAGLDSLPWEGVLGTIAGDDTILIIADGEQSAKNLAEKLKEYQK